MGEYLIRVEGRLSDELAASFPTLDSSPRQQTVLHGAISDQASLAEILEHLRRIGVDVLDVHRVRATPEARPEPDRINPDCSSSPPI